MGRNVEAATEVEATFGYSWLNLPIYKKQRLRGICKGDLFRGRKIEVLVVVLIVIRRTGTREVTEEGLIVVEAEERGGAREEEGGVGAHY